MTDLNLIAGALCLAGVGLLATLFGPAALTGTPGATVFSGSLAVAGVLFLLAATNRTVDLAGRTVDLHDCSGLGDVAVGLAVFGGAVSPPSGVLGAVYLLLVALGGTSAALFGVVGLAEKYGRF